MPKVSQVENKVRNLEGFAIAVRWHHGKDVRGDMQEFRNYPYRKAAKGTMTVADWKRRRFQRHYRGFDVEVLDDRGRVVVGNTKLATLRELAD